MSTSVGGFNCLICLDNFDGWMVIGECGHRASCARCFVINRKHYDKHDCIVCKEKLNRVVISQNTTKSYDDFQFNSLLYSSKADAYFDDEKELNRIEYLFAIVCPCCKKPIQSIDKLKTHVQQLHKKNFCLTCLNKRKVFPYEQRVYTEKELYKHQKDGDVAVGHEGAIPIHIRCKICSKWTFDQDDYNSHMINKHHCCQICRRRGDGERWLLDESHLIQHYATDHLICDFEQCCKSPLENVFENEFALQSHIIKMHSSQVSKQDKRMARRVQLDFQYTSTPVSTSSSMTSSSTGSTTSAAAFPSLSQTTNMESSSTSSSSSSKKLAEQDESTEQIDRSIYSDDIKEANKQIMIEMKKCLGDDGFTLFREVSGTFFRKEINAKQYYEEFNRMFRGNASAGALWMQLVSTLPDFTLRQELCHVHYAAVRSGGGFNIDHKKYQQQQSATNGSVQQQQQQQGNQQSTTATATATATSSNRVGVMDNTSRRTKSSESSSNNTTNNNNNSSSSSSSSKEKEKDKAGKGSEGKLKTARDSDGTSNKPIETSTSNIDKKQSVVNVSEQIIGEVSNHSDKNKSALKKAQKQQQQQQQQQLKQTEAEIAIGNPSRKGQVSNTTTTGATSKNADINTNTKSTRNSNNDVKTNAKKTNNNSHSHSHNGTDDCHSHSRSHSRSNIQLPSSSSAPEDLNQIAMTTSMQALSTSEKCSYPVTSSSAATSTTSSEIDESLLVPYLNSLGLLVGKKLVSFYMSTATGSQKREKSSTATTVTISKDEEEQIQKALGNISLLEFFSLNINPECTWLPDNTIKSLSTAMYDDYITFRAARKESSLDEPSHDMMNVALQGLGPRDLSLFRAYVKASQLFPFRPSYTTNNISTSTISNSSRGDCLLVSRPETETANATLVQNHHQHHYLPNYGSPPGFGNTTVLTSSNTSSNTSLLPPPPPGFGISTATPTTTIASNNFNELVSDHHRNTSVAGKGTGTDNLELTASIGQCPPGFDRDNERDTTTAVNMTMIMTPNTSKTNGSDKVKKARPRKEQQVLFRIG